MRAKRITRGQYLYRGFKIYCVGYLSSDGRYGWEAIDHDGSSFAQSFSLSETKMLVDEEIDKMVRENGR